MPNQVLIIEPQNELKFKGMFDEDTSTCIRLTNPTNNTVLFKIKTTAPKKYYVRPNSGALAPNSKVEITIIPQHFYVDPNETHKHKFMVQSVIAPEGKTNIDQVWKEIHPNQLMDYKLRCVFETPREANPNDSGDTAAQNEVTKKRVAVADEAKSSNVPQVTSSKDDIVQATNVQERGGKKEEGPAESLSMITISKSENVESDLKKATNEVIHLREEESKLRHENLRLKEEVLRLHQQVGGEHTVMRGGHSYGPEKKEQLSAMPWLGISIAMVLLGIIVGKFFM